MSLFVVDESMLLEPPMITRGSWQDTLGEIKVQYSRRTLDNLGIIQVATSFGGVFFLMSDGTIYGWDGCGYGACGQCEPYGDCCVYYTYPQKVKMSAKLLYDWNEPQSVAPGRLTDICANSGHEGGFFLDEHGQIWALGNCGIRSNCGCGHETEPDCDDDCGWWSQTVNCLTPVAGGYRTHVFSKMYKGHHNGIAIDEDGLLWTWGWADYGQIGNGKHEGGNGGYESGINCVPVPFNPIRGAQDGSIDIANKTWSEVAFGWYAAIAIDTEGRLWTWGMNWMGMLGHGVDEIWPDSPPFSTWYWPYPTQVGTDTDWYKVYAAELSLAAMKTDGTVWFAGDNHYGGFGDGTQNDSNVFTQGGGNKSFNEFRHEYYYSLGREGIGPGANMWVWGMELGYPAGSEGDGNLGLGAKAKDQFETPQPFPVVLNLFDIGYAGPNIGVDYSGKVWVWGEPYDYEVWAEGVIDPPKYMNFDFIRNRIPGGPILL